MCYLRNMCDQAGGLQYGYHWLNLAGGTARCVRSGLHCRALIKVFITITATNDSNPFQVYRGDDENPPEGRLYICSYQYGVINRFLGITSFASVQVAVVTLHAWFFFSFHFGAPRVQMHAWLFRSFTLKDKTFRAIHLATHWAIGF